MNTKIEITVQEQLSVEELAKTSDRLSSIIDEKVELEDEKKRVK